MTIAAAVAVAVLLVTSIPWWRVIADRRFRALFPKETAMVFAVLLAGLVIAIVAAVIVPLAVLIAAAVAAVIASAAAWRARVHRGRSSAWPPGKVSITGSVRAMAHREAHLDAVSKWGPVYKTAQFHRPVAGLIGMTEARAVLREHHASLGASVLPFNESVTGGFLRYMSDDDHDRYGSMFRRALGGSALSGVAESTIRALDPVLERVRREGALTSSELRSSLAGVSSAVCLATLFGVAPDDDSHRRLSAALASAFGPPGSPVPRRPDFASVRAIIAGLPVGTRPCALSSIAEAGHDPADPVVLDNLVVVQVLGTANLAGLLAWVLQYLGIESDRWRDGLADDHGGPVATAFVSEVLRHSQSEYLYRRVTSAFDLKGFHIPAGWWLRVGVWESHRQPEAFATPREAMERFAPGAATPEYAPFGIDRHACSGASLSLRSGAAFVSTVAAARDVEVIPAGGVVRGFRHWSHWRPDDSLTLRVVG